MLAVYGGRVFRPIQDGAGWLVVESSRPHARWALTPLPGSGKHLVVQVIHGGAGRPDTHTVRDTIDRFDGSAEDCAVLLGDYAIFYDPTDKPEAPDGGN